MWRAGMISNDLQSVEKRENARKDLEVQLIANPIDTPYFIQGWVQNISFGGIRVKNRFSPSPFEKEEEIRFFIKKDDLVLSGEGRVVWTNGMQGEVGIKFTHLADEMRSSLEKFLGLLA